jgi:hypothetical protein
MVSPRLVNIAQGLVLVALVSDIANFLNVGSKNTLGIISLATGTAAFFVARKSESVIVSSGLIAKGAFDTTLAVQTTILDHSLGALVFGVTFGSWILALGIAKTVTTVKAIRLSGQDEGAGSETLTTRMVRSIGFVVNSSISLLGLVAPSTLMVWSLSKPFLERLYVNDLVSMSREEE